MVNLFEAIIQKNIQKVKSILEQGANPNFLILEVGGSIFNRDSDGVSVIECASINPETHRLIRKKCVINGSIN